MHDLRIKRGQLRLLPLWQYFLLHLLKAVQDYCDRSLLSALMTPPPSLHNWPSGLAIHRNHQCNTFFFFATASLRACLTSPPFIPHIWLAGCKSSHSSKEGKLKEAKVKWRSLSWSYLHLWPSCRVQGWYVSSVAAGHRRCAGTSSLSSWLRSPPLHSTRCLLPEPFAQLFPSLTAFIPDERRSLLH